MTNTLPLCPAHLSLYFAKPAIDLTSFFPALGTTVSKPFLPCAAKQGLNKHSLLSTPLNQPLIGCWKTPFQTVYYQKWTSEMCGENLRWFSVKRFLTQTSTTKLSWSCSWTWCSQSIWYQACTVQCDLIVFSQVTFSMSSRPVHPLGALQPQTRLALEVFGKSCRPLKMSLLAATTSMALQYLGARGEGTSEQTAERIECFETILNTDGNVVHPASYQFQIVGVCHWWTKGSTTNCKKSWWVQWWSSLEGLLAMQGNEGYPWCKLVLQQYLWNCCLESYPLISMNAFLMSVIAMGHQGAPFLSPCSGMIQN